MFVFEKLVFIAQIQICIMGLRLNFIAKSADCATQVLHMNETFLLYGCSCVNGGGLKINTPFGTEILMLGYPHRELGDRLWWYTNCVEIIIWYEDVTFTRHLQNVSSNLINIAPKINVFNSTWSKRAREHAYVCVYTRRTYNVQTALAKTQAEINLTVFCYEPR